MSIWPAMPKISGTAIPTSKAVSSCARWALLASGELGTAALYLPVSPVFTHPVCKEQIPEVGEETVCMEDALFAQGMGSRGTQWLFYGGRFMVSLLLTWFWKCISLAPLQLW